MKDAARPWRRREVPAMRDGLADRENSWRMLLGHDASFGCRFARDTRHTAMYRS